MNSDSDEETEQSFQKITIADNKELNILLLGETGVGKSTFINSVLNYLLFTDLKEAERTQKLTVLIPTKLNITDKNGKLHEIEIGENSDKNEYISNGQSATQDVKSYVFQLPEELGKNGNMRFLDTPGIGDTRGIEQDDINCDTILNFIAKYEQIHAICVLLKPTNTRFTPSFVYCIKKILSHLDKSAARNIIFCFTNTRASNYTPGETRVCLEEIIKEVYSNSPHVKIPFNNNVFCFDNEGFKYLAALKKNVEISHMALSNAVLSWNQSSRECVNMISYISRLPPHAVNNTVSINEARKCIWQLTKPLIDVSDLIDNKIRRIEKHQSILKDEKNSIEQLKDNLYIPLVNLKLKELPQPVTVCTNHKCIEIVRVEEVQYIHYKTQCHKPCLLKGIPKEIVGDTKLKNCSAMVNNHCRVCGCSYKVHMHIYYETETYFDRIMDRNINDSIKSKEDIIKEKKKLTIEMKQIVKELKKERKYIIETNARFACFLQNNAIAPFNDSYAEYIHYLIDCERSLGIDANENNIRRWQDLSEQHEQMKSAFDEASKRGDPNFDLTPYGIQENLNQLFSLQHMGRFIKDIFESQKKTLRKEREHHEYVHDALEKDESKVAPAESNEKEEEISTTNIQQTPTSTVSNEFKHKANIASQSPLNVSQKYLFSNSDDLESKNLQGQDRRNISSNVRHNYDLERRYFPESNERRNPREYDAEYRRDPLEKFLYKQRDNVGDERIPVRNLRRENEHNSCFEYEYNSRRPLYSDYDRKELSFGNRENEPDIDRFGYRVEREDYGYNFPYKLKDPRFTNPNDDDEIVRSSMSKPQFREREQDDRYTRYREEDYYRHPSIQKGSYSTNPNRYRRDERFEYLPKNVSNNDRYSPVENRSVMRENEYKSMRPDNQNYERDYHQNRDQYRRPYPEERKFLSEDSEEKYYNSGNFGTHTGSYQNTNFSRRVYRED